MAYAIFMIQKEGALLMGATVLIVDDNLGFRTLLRQISEQQADLRVVGEAEDGQEAIRRVHELRPDLILLDLILPQVNGLEATRQIKATYPATKIIIVTVHTDDAYRRAAEASGADAFLLKKTLMTALLPAIQGMFNLMS